MLFEPFKPIEDMKGSSHSPQGAGNITRSDLTTLFLSRQGYTVLQANSPSEALSLAREHANEIHLLITDVILPEINGKDLANRLLAEYSHFKCLFMSGYTADTISQYGLSHDNINFIHKPFTLPCLAFKVREVLDGH